LANIKWSIEGATKPYKLFPACIRKDGLMTLFFTSLNLQGSFMEFLRNKTAALNDWIWKNK
jgi:hypothetical protein